MEMAAEMYVSYSTVKTHVSHLLTKLDTRDRAELVISGIRPASSHPRHPGSSSTDRDPDSDRGTTAGGKLRGVRWPGRLGLRA